MRLTLSTRESLFAPRSVKRHEVPACIDHGALGSGEDLCLKALSRRGSLRRYSTRWPSFGLYPNVNNFSSGAPRATTLATYSPIAGPFLKPRPEPPPTIHTLSISG